MGPFLVFGAVLLCLAAAFLFLVIHIEKKNRQRVEEAERRYKKRLADIANVDKDTEKEVNRILSDPTPPFSDKAIKDLHERTKKPWPPKE